MSNANENIETSSSSGSDIETGAEPIRIHLKPPSKQQQQQLANTGPTWWGDLYVADSKQPEADDYNLPVKYLELRYG